MMGSSKIEHKLPLQVLEELALGQKPTIVMSEGHDPRIISGAIAAHNSGICQIALLGNQIMIKAECKSLGLSLPTDIIILGAVSVMAVEVAPIPMNDNLTIPLTGGFVMTYGMMIL